MQEARGPLLSLAPTKTLTDILKCGTSFCVTGAGHWTLFNLCGRCGIYFLHAANTWQMQVQRRGDDVLTGFKLCLWNRRGFWFGTWLRSCSHRSQNLLVTLWLSSRAQTSCDFARVRSHLLWRSVVADSQESWRRDLIGVLWKVLLIYDHLALIEVLIWRSWPRSSCGGARVLLRS